MKLPYIEVENQDDESLVYNVTTKVDHSIARQWLAWMKEEHIPDLLATGCFTDARILQLTEVDETDGLTYAVQFSSPGRDSYNRYITEFAEPMRRKESDRWGALTTAFRSVLRVVN